MKSAFHRYTSQQRFEIQQAKAPTIITFEMLPWIPRNTLMFSEETGGVVQVDQYSDELRQQNPVALGKLKFLKHEQGLTPLFNPPVKISANNSLLFLESTEDQRQRNKTAPLERHFPVTHSLFAKKDFIPGSVEDVKTFLRDFEKSNNEHGWLIDKNPLFWRYFWGFVDVIKTSSDPENWIYKAFGLKDGRMYNFAYFLLLYDWLGKHHTRLGDHAIPLTTHLLNSVNYDPDLSRRLLKEVNGHYLRPKMTLGRRLQLDRELFNVLHGTAKSNKQLVFQSQKLLGRRVKPYDFFLYNALINDPALLTADQKLEVFRKYDLPLTRGGKRVTEDNFKIEVAEIREAFEKSYDEAGLKNEEFYAYIESLPDPLVVYKGAVVLSTETIRGGKGGKTSESFVTLSESHLKRIGTSFTLNPLIAEWFATKSLHTLTEGPIRFLFSIGKLRAVVVRYEIPKDRVFFITNLRGEAEVMIDNERALTIRDYKFCFPAIEIRDSDRLGKSERVFVGLENLNHVAQEKFIQGRLENPTMKSSQANRWSYTSYPTRQNIASLFFTGVYGDEWLSKVKLAKKFRSAVQSLTP